MDKKEASFILIRYLFLIGIAIPNLYLFYKIFTPLTVSSVFLVLNNLYDAILFPGEVIFFKGYYAAIIPACVAGSAYYLLLMLNLSSPMPLIKRVYLLIFSWGSLLILNILRIIIFAMLLTWGYQYFDQTHILVWYVISTLLVATIWFVGVWLFDVKTIPFYSDLKSIWQETK